MTYPKVLPRPPYLSDYHGAVRVRIRYDNRDLCISQACGPVELPEDIPVSPLVTYEALGNDGRLIFPVQAWDYGGDKGRGGWAIYNERLFPVPESKPEVEPTPASQLVSDEVEEAGVESPDITITNAVRPSVDEPEDEEDDD